MRLIDIAVFMLIFEVVVNILASSLIDQLGFHRSEVIKISTDVDIEKEAKKRWEEVQNFASAAILMGTVAGAFVSAVFGQYYLSLLLAAAGFVINFVPNLKEIVAAFPTVLMALGVPQSLASAIFVIYNFLLILVLLLWLTGKGGY